jgi:hypothetical protein
MANKIQIQIPDWSSIEDAWSWDCKCGDEVEFRIKRESGIQLFATGAAIAAVHRIRSKASTISIRCEFTFPTEPIETWRMQQWPGFFLTLVGVAMLHASRHIIDSSGVDLSSSVFDAMWCQILTNTGGIVGDGKSQALVSREFDSPIPEALRSSETHKLPSRREFEQVLGKLGQGLGAGKRFFGSSTEAALSSFLFETFRNCIEHAKPPSEGIWGIVIEKIILQSTDEISRRGQIPSFIREVFGQRFRKKNQIWICVTVADFGCGIQGTLPPFPGESEWSRLIRAFERGVSRKPRSGSPNRGQGLANIIDSAARLSACIFVNSAGLAAFNEAEPSNPIWSKVEVPPGLHGTSVSLLWPIGGESPDQETLQLGL